MKVNYEGLAEQLKKGVLALEKYGFLATGCDGLKLTAKQGDSVTITKTETEIAITYDTVPHFYMALGRSAGVGEGTHAIECKLERFGIMWDCSRNAVPKPEMAKQFICHIVLAGYNYLQLYTEDVYELPDEPYFGYKRGRFSQTELKEIVAFADIFELEMVPCIQVLAHLRHLANWIMYYDHMDIDDVLLVRDERTYALIRKMLTFCKETFHTKRINIGSDEAFRLGRGNFTDRYGYLSKEEVYLEHLTKMFEICKEMDVEPEFWADAFYKDNQDAQLPIEQVKPIFDGTQVPVYWDYYEPSKEHHFKKLKQLQQYTDNVKYTGGLWTWIGYAPDNGFTDKITNYAFAAAEECGVKDIMMATWGDDGSECSVFAVTPSMWYAASKIYPVALDMDKTIEEWTGYTDKEWRACDSLNTVMPEIDQMSNAVKYMMANDYLIGLLDANTPHHAGDRFAELYPKFVELAQKESPFAYIFKAYAAMAKVLIHKATFSKRLYEAYQAGDKGTMNEMLKELPIIRETGYELLDAYRELWMQENKGFGFEVFDVRIGGGLITRTYTVEKVVKDYLAGKTEKIYELEEGRLEYFCGRYEGEKAYAAMHGHWGTAYTVNRIE